MRRRFPDRAHRQVAASCAASFGTSFGASLGLLLLLVGGDVPRAHARSVSYGIAIGNNAPAAGQVAPVLRYADDDAARFYQLFRRFSETSFLLSVLDPDTQRRYPELASVSKAPTRANLLQIVTELAQQMSQDRARGDEPVLYFSYSGHGLRDGAEAAGLALLDGLLTQEILYEHILSRLPLSYGHLFIDACHAGAVVGLRGPGGEPRTSSPAKELEAVRAPVSSLDLRALTEGRRARFPMIGILAASTDGHESHEWSRLQSGVFSHEVLSGLLGAADANRDLKLEYSEVHAFVAAANHALPDPQAAPQLLVSPPPINQRVPLLVLRALRDTAFLTGPAAQLGRFYIELANGQRYLDARFGADASPTLAVPAQTQLFIRTVEHEAELIVPAEATVRLDTLALHPRSSSSRGSVELAFERALFVEPYGPAYYRGFTDSQGLPSVVFADSLASATGGPGQAATPSLPARSYRRPLAISLLVLGGTATAAAVAAGSIALKARADFDATLYQREAFAARDLYAQGSAVFWPCLSIAAVSALGTGLAWTPRGKMGN